MTLSEFEQELRKLHSDFSVMKLNPNSQTAGVIFRGVYQFAIGGGGIYKEKNDAYGLAHPSGTFIRHRTLPEALAMAKKILREMRKGSEDYQAQMGLGKFSDSEMKKLE